MPPFDLTLTDPAPAAVEAAMARAVEEANLRCRVGLMAVERAEYRRFVSNDFDGPEGVAIWVAEKGRVETFPPTPRATMLGLAWWTTPPGRKVVRIAGRRVEPFKENPSNRFGPPWRAWPALCHLDPDHVVTVSRDGGEPTAVAICGCGAVGPPDKLGWMLGRCGPCHDHIEEHGRPLDAGEGPAALRTQGHLIEVGFTPSGKTVAAVEWTTPRIECQVAIWDRRSGECLSANATPSSSPLPRKAGGLLLSGGHRAYWISERLLPALAMSGPRQFCVSMVFEGRTATAVSYDGSGWRRDLTKDDAWAALWPERRSGRDVIYFSLALAPNGRVALGLTECTVELTDIAGGQGPPLRPDIPEAKLPINPLDSQRICALAFSPDEKILAAGAGRSGFVDDPAENWFGRGGGLYLYDAVTRKYLAGFPRPNDDIIAVAFSPDGSLLFAGSTDCTVRVVDVAKRKEVAVLGGHVGAVNALAFSPDGETLASAGGDGLVRLWPWRAVLGL